MESGVLAAILIPVGAKDVQVRLTVLRVLHRSGNGALNLTLQVGTPLCIVVDSSGDVAAFSNYKQAPPPKAAAATSSTPQPTAKPQPASKPSAAATEAPATPLHQSIPSDLLAGPAVAPLSTLYPKSVSFEASFSFRCFVSCTRIRT